MISKKNKKNDKFIGSYHPFPKEEPTWTVEEKINYLRKHINKEKLESEIKKGRLKQLFLDFIYKKGNKD